MTNKELIVFANELDTQDTIDDCTRYALDVVLGRIKTSKYIMYACMRHILFLNMEKTNPEFPYTFKKNPLKKLINFCNHIIVPQINKPFIFPSFRRFMAGFVFG